MTLSTAGSPSITASCSNSIWTSTMRWRRRSASSTPRWSGGSLASTKQAKPAETLSRLIELLVSIPGVSYLSAITIISEIGSNMSRFQSRRSSHRLGEAVSRTERERGQTQAQPPAQGRALVEDHARSMRLGRQAAEKQLLQGAILSTADQTRATESRLRRRRLDSQPPSTTSSRTAFPTKTSASTTSTTASPRPRPSGWSPNSPSSASKRPSNRSRKRRDAVLKGK